MKTAKTTVTILSALASVVLLASCATKSTETQTSIIAHLIIRLH